MQLHAESESRVMRVFSGVSCDYEKVRPPAMREAASM